MIYYKKTHGQEDYKHRIVFSRSIGFMWDDNRLGINQAENYNDDSMLVCSMVKKYIKSNYKMFGHLNVVKKQFDVQYNS